MRSLTIGHRRHQHRGARALGYLGVGVGLTWIALARRRAGPMAARTPKPVRRAITIAVPPAQVYAFWRDLENLPSFKPRLVSIEPLDPRRSRWRARGPAGKLLEWEAEIIEDIPDRLIRWESHSHSPLRHRGSVRFRAAPGLRGTEVVLEIQLEPPAGGLAREIASEIGRWFASLTSQAIGIHLQNDLRRLKQILEVGEVVCSDASAHHGLHPARPEPSIRLVEKDGAP